MSALRQRFNSHIVNRRAFVALLMGAPGSGKGTISKYIVRDFDFRHVSTGDILRSHIESGSIIGKKAERYVSAGSLVPDEIMMDLVAAQLDCGSQQRVLLDGFPRTRIQAEQFDPKITVDIAINLDVPIEIIVNRLSNRWIHAPSGRIYSYDFNPPKENGKDDVSGEPLVQREDDKVDTVRARLRTYVDKSKPLLDYYAEKRILKNFQGSESKVIYVGLRKYLSERLGRSLQSS